MDSFFGIGLFELIMIAVVALLVLGPERLPGAMREVAKWMRQLRNLSSEFQSQFSEEFKMLDDLDPRRIINEAIDPKTQTRPASPPGAKQNSAQQPPKPPAAKPLTPPAPKSQAAPVPAATAVAVANGEPQNTILPPKAQPKVADAAGAPSDAPATAKDPAQNPATDTGTHPLTESAPDSTPDSIADSGPGPQAGSPPAEAAPADDQKPEAPQ